MNRSQEHFDDEFREIMQFNAEYNHLIEDVVVPVAADDDILRIGIRVIRLGYFPSEDRHEEYIRHLQRYMNKKYDVLPDFWPDVCVAVHRKELENSVSGGS